MHFAFLKIRYRILLLVFLNLLGMASVFVLATHAIKASLFETRYERTRMLVETAHSMILSVAQEDQNHGLSFEQAQRSVLQHLKNIKYDNNQYFFVFDADGKTLMHPQPELLGKDTLNLQDAKGKYLIREFLDIANSPAGEGFSSYYWPPGKNSALKVSYIKGIREWGWIIGSGVVVDDIQRHVNAVEKELAIATLVIISLAFLLALLIARSVSQPLLSLNHVMRHLAEGDLDIQIKEINRKDEIGSMARTVGVFLENARHIAMLEREQKGSDSMKSEFVSVVSHELRTPLTSIRGSLGLIAAGTAGTLPDKALHLVNIAHANCQRLLLLINDILDIDKIAAGNMQFNKKHHSLNRLVQQTIEATRAFAEKYFVRYAYEPLSPDITINIDEARFQQVLTNFLSNAAKFSLGGAKVDVLTTIHDHWVRIAVKDYGMGIPDDFRSRIFKKFSQADSSLSRRKGGTGLGLYISKQLIEQMGGRVGYESKAGLGSTFWIDYPTALPETEIAEAKSDAKQSLISYCALDEKPTLLHIDPSAEYNAYFTELMGEITNIKHFTSIGEAKEYFEKSADLLCSVTVVSELNLKDMPDCTAFLTQAKMKGAFVIILSSREPRADIRSLADAVIIKSLSSDDKLVATILDTINRSHAQPTS